MRNIEKDITISDLLYKSLYGKLSEDEQMMLDCWLKDEGNRKFYEELLQPEKLYEDVLEMAELDTGMYYRGLQRHIKRKERFRLWLTIGTIAAVLILSIGLIRPFGKNNVVKTQFSDPFVFQFSTNQTTLRTEKGKVYVFADSIEQIKTENILLKDPAFQGEAPVGSGGKIEYNLLTTSSRGNIEVILADSTRVWLNAGSRLHYPNRFTAGKRVVELVGEAYFEVARNERQPFIVKAGTTQIEVLGTQFNVNAKEGTSCITTLVKGCVKVRNKVKDTVVIYPGQQVNVPSEGTMVVKSVDTHFYTAWKRNRFAFQNEPLYQILEQLSEWYDCTFEFSHYRLANLHFTTVVPRYDEISQVLGILQATREFGFIKTGRHIRIIDYKQVN